MPAGRADLVGEVGAEDLRLDRRAVGVQHAFAQPGIGLFVLAERHDSGDAGLLGAALELRELRIVAIEDGGAAGFEAEKNLRLGVGDLGERTEEFEMHRRDRSDDRDMRTGEPRQRRDLAGVVHSHFQHRVMRARRAARERERHAPMIVVGGDRGVRLAILAEREPQRLLGSGLADRTGDADHLGRRADARRGGKIAQRGKHIRHQQERRAARHRAAAIGGDDGQRGIGLERPRDEFMSVALIAPNGEERIAGGNRAAVDRNAGDRLRRRALALGADRRSHRVNRPQRARRHAASSLSAAATAS